MKTSRFWVVVLLLAATALLLHRRGDADRVPRSEPVSAMPLDIGPWSGQDIPMDDAVLGVLGKGDFLNRVYTDPAAARTPPVGLFIGYFATQRTGQTIHSPQHCLPGAGWTFESSRYTDLQDTHGKTYRVGQYVISNGESRQFVLYWYQAHGRSIANEYISKAYMIADAMRLNRTDGALVRVITPIAPNESVDAAKDRVLKFTGLMAPQLSRFIPV